MNELTQTIAAIDPRHWIPLVSIVLIVVTYLIFKKKEKEDKDPVILDLPQPDWEMDSRLSGALIAPTRSIYSTHMQTGNVSSVRYKGIDYKVTKQTVVDDPRAKSYSEYGTDITILDHEPVLHVYPVKIANFAPSEGDRVIAYLKDKVVKCIADDSDFTVYFRGGAVGGDSSSPVVNEKGNLVTLQSVQNGKTSSGPNLVAIRDVLLNGLEE